MKIKELKNYLGKKALIYTEIEGLSINFKGYLTKEKRTYTILGKLKDNEIKYEGFYPKDIIEVEVIQ